MQDLTPLAVAGSVALVTGAAAGTGAAVARRLAEAGAEVVLADADAAGESLASELGGRFVHADLTEPADVARMVAAAGGLRVLVNVAGGQLDGPQYPEAPPERWVRAIELNLISAMRATQLALEPMRRAGGGAVVNVASAAGTATDAYASPEYGAAKAGLIRFTTCLADLDGVRVNCIVPDWIETDRARAELAAMTEAERAAAPVPIPMDVVTGAIMRLIVDGDAAGRVVEIGPGGRIL